MFSLYQRIFGASISRILSLFDNEGAPQTSHYFENFLSVMPPSQVHMTDEKKENTRERERESE